MQALEEVAALATWAARRSLWKAVQGQTAMMSQLTASVHWQLKSLRIESDGIGSAAGGKKPSSDSLPEIEGEPFWNAAAAGRIKEEPQAALLESALLSGDSQDASEPSEIVVGSDVGELPDAWYKEERGTGEEPFWNSAGRGMIRVKTQQAKQASKGRQRFL